MDNTTIQKFLDEHDYDIRKTHNGRWIDQKCTMDVVCLVSDCIRGKVPTKYFVKRFYGVEDTCEIPQEEGKEWFHA